MRLNESGFSESFESISPEAIESAIINGASKINNFLSTESAGSLLAHGTTSVPSLLTSRAPELADYFSILGIDDDDYPRLAVDGLSLPANYGDVHTDNISGGITILLPILGGSALFAANNNFFNITESPEFITQYGIGDAIIVRQRLNSVNGVKLDLSPAAHVGRGQMDRRVLAIDFITNDLNYKPKKITRTRTVLPTSAATSAATSARESTTTKTARARTARGGKSRINCSVHFS